MDEKTCLAEKLKTEHLWAERRTVVFMSDFGTGDGAVSAMHGVADEVCRDLKLEDLTHEIPQFNIWEASYRLIQAMTYWAPGTVFVCVVDPGVGSDRKSVAVLTRSGHVVVTPDNGTLTHVARQIGIVERREISEAVNRLKDSQRSYTFHGRDVYAYTGARLAAGVIGFNDIGERLDDQVVHLDVQDSCFDGKRIVGAIDILDTRYGSLWTNISDSLFSRLGVQYGEMVRVTISDRGRIVYGYEIKYCKNFTEVGRGEALLYINSLLNVGVAVNQGSFSAEYRIGTGEGWVITLEKVTDPAMRP